MKVVLEFKFSKELKKIVPNSYSNASRIYIVKEMSKKQLEKLKKEMKDYLVSSYILKK